MGIQETMTIPDAILISAITYCTVVSMVSVASLILEIHTQRQRETNQRCIKCRKMLDKPDKK